MASLPVWKFALIVGAHLTTALAFRQALLPRVVESKPIQRQSASLFALDYALFVAAGIAVALFNLVVFAIPPLNGLEIALGFATAGLLPALDLSLDWEHRIITGTSAEGHTDFAPESYSPQTRTFALLASGILIFATFVLLLLLWRDIAWVKTQNHNDALLAELLHSVAWEVLFVMGMFLGLTLTVIVSYARNLRLLFAKQTEVLELVSQGELGVKVPVVTKDEFAVIAGHTNTMIDRLRERERMSRGLELARQIQANLLPHSSPLLAGVQVFGASQFSDETGGDFYDYLTRESAEGPELVLMVGDVTGHGVGSALLMASVRAYLRAHLPHIADLAEVMGCTNTLICRDVADSGYVTTVFLLAYLPGSHRVRWVSAGHAPALFHGYAQEACVELRGTDIPLGVDAQWRYTQITGQLEPGVLLLATDGVWEATSPDGAMFDRQRLRRALHDHLQASPRELSARIFAEIEAFTGEERIDDDRTMITARFFQS